MKPIKFNNNNHLPKEALILYKPKQKNNDMKSKEELLEGSEHYGSYIPIMEVKRLMEEYANERLQELSLTDMAEEYIKKELPNAEKPFHYDAEGAVCIRDFVKWARNKLTGK